MKKIKYITAVMLVFICMTQTAFAATQYNNSYKSDKRYIVTSNHHYDNKYNTLAKEDTIKAARAIIKEQPSKYKGQWYVYDSQTQKIVWPDISTDEKKVDKIIKWCVAVGNDPRHGYDTEGERFSTGTDLKYKRWGKCGDYGCSPLVETPFELFNFFNMRTYAYNHNLTYYTSDGLGPIRGFNANNIVATLKGSKKFRNVSSSFAKKGKAFLQPGDIVVNSNQTHTAIIVTKNRIVEGNLNENYIEFGVSQPGDQRNGGEINISNYMSGSYSFYKEIKYVFRPKI